MRQELSAFGLIADNDKRVVAASFQGRGLDDAWAVLLASTLETNTNLQILNLNE